MHSNSKPLLLRIYYDAKVTNDHPWKVQEKGRFFWWTIKSCRSEQSANNELRSIAEVRVRRKSGVIKEYSEQDYLADVLKRSPNRNYEGEGEDMMAQGATTMAMPFSGKAAADVNMLKKLAGINKA